MQTTTTKQTKKTRHRLHPSQKLNIDDRPKCKTSNYKALRKNRRENLDELGFDDEMSETEQKALSKKQKIGM